MAKKGKSTVGVFLGANSVGRPSKEAKKTLKFIVRLPFMLAKGMYKLLKTLRRLMRRYSKRKKK